MKGRISTWLGAAADVLMPRVCAVCGGRLLRTEKHICLPCLADMPLTRFWTMKHNPMADRFNAVIQSGLETTLSGMTDGMVSEGYRPAGMGGRERYAYAAALLIYKDGSGYTDIPQQLKYHGNIEAGRHFGRMLGRKLASSELFEDVDMVIPVPLHWMRRWKRGYNQAEVIAAEVGAELGAEMDCRILSRKRRTRTQTRLGVEEKAANVAGAFSVRNGRRGNSGMKGRGTEGRSTEGCGMEGRGTEVRGMKGNGMEGRGMEGRGMEGRGMEGRGMEGCDKRKDGIGGDKVRHILLIDDVFTTGSTVGACFHALRKVFPPSVRISVATLAFVGQ